MKPNISRRQVLKAGACTLAAAMLPRNASAQAKPAQESAVKKLPASPALSDHPVIHGGIQLYPHPELGVDVHGETSIRYLRFGKQVKLDYLELGRLREIGKIRYGRWLGTHPAHLIISVLDRDNFTWKTIREADLPAEPGIMGTAELNAGGGILKLLEKPAHRIELGGLETDHLRVICDREHPTLPDHVEFCGGVQNVPFGILHKLGAFGNPVGPSVFEIASNPALKQGSIRPEAPKGMQVRDLPEMLLFEGKHLAIGFSLRRPMLMHVGCDILGNGQTALNRLFITRYTNINISRVSGMICGLSGPALRTLYGDYPSYLWTGEVAVEGNRILYRNLRAIDGLTIDAIFTVEEDRVTLELTQHCVKDLPVIEAEAWRLSWDLGKGITGMAGKPTHQPGRNGDVPLPGIWASDGSGCISWSLLSGNPAETRLQVESYRASKAVSGGIVFGQRPGPDHCQVIPAGKRQATFELAVTNLEPVRKPGAPEPSAGLKRQWASTFACFRPEYRGFSNHSASGNCHLSQMPAIDIVAHTKPNPKGPKPLDLARFTIEKGLLDGGGYGYHRNLYLDSDPVLLSSAGRIHQTDPNLNWLKRIEPGLIQTVNRMLDSAGDDGLMVCRDLTGNSGSNRWGTNYMDIMGFGHIDGYSNAWAYRAFRNAAAMLEDLSHHTALVKKCRQAAQRLRENYASVLLNPETGWIGGWRSRDGQLHDYAFTWVNGVALAFGLVDPAVARNALLGLERKRNEVGMGDARIGLPCNLLPIRSDDHQLSGILRELLEPTFGTYTEGLTAWGSSYYLRALAIHGLGAQAKKLARELAEGYAAGLFSGGDGTGAEYRSWEGLETGYEGSLIGSFGSLYAIAIEEGIFDAPNPEWWPVNG